MTSDVQNDDSPRKSDCIEPCHEVALAVMRGIPDPMILADSATAEILYINAAAELMLGKTCAEIKGKHIFDIHPLAETGFEEKMFERETQLEICDVSDSPVVNSSGQITHYDIRITPLIAGGRLLLMESFRDVTDRRKAQSDVIDAEHRFLAAIDNSPMGLHLYRLEKNGTVVFTAANKSADRILGVSNSLFIGKTIEEAFPPLAMTEVPDQYRRIAMEGGCWRSEHVDYEDEKIRGAFQVIAFQVKPGETGVMFWDITDRLKAEAEMKRLMAAINAMDGAVVITDAKAIIQYVNPCFERLTGYKLDEIKGTHIGSIKSGEQGKEFYERMWEVLSKGESWSGFLVNRRKDGTLYHEQVTISPVTNTVGRIINYVAVKRDITHELDLEKRVLRSQKMAALGQFAHRVAHDMTNALSIILGSADVIARTVQNDTTKELLGNITASVDRVSGLAANLMAFANPGRMQLRRQLVDRCITGMKEIIEKACHPNVLVSYDMEPGLYAQIDPDYLEQAVMHVVVNATEAIATQGTLQIRIRKGRMPAQLALIETVTELEEVPAVLIEIEDSGTGMTEEECAQAFEPFFSTKRDRRRNAGLGLPTVYSIISQFNGDVHITSSKGKGATVHITIPRVD